MHWLLGDIRGKGISALQDSLKDHVLVADQKGSRLWYFDPGLLTEYHPYSQHNVYLKPGVFDKASFGNARSLVEAVANEAEDVFMTFDAGVNKGGIEIKKAFASMYMSAQSIFLIPSETSLQKRRDMMRATPGAEFACHGRVCLLISS